MYLVYQNSIQAYATKNQFDAAKKLELESKEFSERELAAISLNITSKTKPDVPNVEKPVDDKDKNPTKQRMAEFFTAYTNMLQEINDQPTTVKQDEVHRNLTKKIDDALKNQTWEFHCRIKDIQPGRGGRFDISHDFPDEFPSPDQEWQGRASATVPLTQQQALTLKPGDYVIYTGTPRFTLGRDGSDTEYFSRNDQIAQQYAKHSIHMTNVKIKFQKDVAAKDDDAQVTPRGFGKKTGK